MNTLIRRILFPIICLVITINVNAQGTLNKPSDNGQQHFLWFTGHWSKTKKHTFITSAYTDSTESGVMKMPGGNTITVNSNGSVNISSSGIDDWNKKIDDGEKNLEKAEDQMKSPDNETQEWAYHFNEAAMPLLNGLKEEWSSLKVDKKDDMLSPKQDQQNQGSNEEQATQNFTKNLAAGCKRLQPKYQAIVDYYHAHRKDKDNDLPPPPAPPEFEYKCLNCDSTAYKNYLKQCDKYAEDFPKPESGYIRDALGFLRELALLGGGSADFNQAIDPLFEKSGPCGYLEYGEDLNKIVQWLFLRLHIRAYKLMKKYEGENYAYKVMTPVMRTYLGISRQCGIMGMQVDGDLAEASKLAFNAFQYYYSALVEKHDWSQLANVPLIFSLYRQYAMISGDDAEGSNIVTNIFKILNSFTLNVEMDAKEGKDGGYFLAHLKGKAKITPEFKSGNDSCYEWVVVNDQPDRIGQPIRKVGQKIETDLLANEIVAPKDWPEYVGTKKFYASLAQLKMNFCTPGKDTILLSGFIPEPNAMAATWRYPQTPQLVPGGINGLDHLFQDVEKMKELAQSGAAQQQANIAKDQAEKLAAQMKKLAAEIGNKRDPASIAKYQEFINKMHSGQQLFNNQNLAPILYIDFPLQIQNNSATLFKKRFDAKEVNPLVASTGAIVYGYYTVDIEYKAQH